MKYGDSLYRCKELKRAAFVRTHSLHVYNRCFNLSASLTLALACQGCCHMCDLCS